MTTNARSARLVPALAVAAVSAAALAAVASSWMDRSEATLSLAAGQQRPAADAPVDVVKAPAPAPAARQQPVGCRDCERPATEQRL